MARRRRNLSEKRNEEVKVATESLSSRLFPSSLRLIKTFRWKPSTSFSRSKLPRPTAVLLSYLATRLPTMRVRRRIQHSSAGLAPRMVFGSLYRRRCSLGPPDEFSAGGMDSAGRRWLRRYHELTVYHIAGPPAALNNFVLISFSHRIAVPQTILLRRRKLLSKTLHWPIVADSKRIEPFQYLYAKATSVRPWFSELFPDRI